MLHSFWHVNILQWLPQGEGKGNSLPPTPWPPGLVPRAEKTEQARPLRRSGKGAAHVFGARLLACTFFVHSAAGEGRHVLG